MKTVQNRRETTRTARTATQQEVITKAITSKCSCPEASQADILPVAVIQLSSQMISR